MGSSKSTTAISYLSQLTRVVPETGESYSELCFKLSESAAIELNKAAQIICYAIYHGLIFVDTFSTKNISNNTIIRQRKDKKFQPFPSLWEELQKDNQKQTTSVTNPKEPDLIQSEDSSVNSITFRIPPKYEEKVDSRMKILSLWMKQPKIKRTLEWRTEFCKQWKVSEKTVYNWAEAYRKDGIEGLIPKHERSGKQVDYDPQFAEILEQCRQYFFTPLISQQNTFTKLKELCEKHNVPLPKFSQLMSYIYHNSTASDFASKRGQKYLKANFTPSLASFQGAFAPMQIVQMDNTSLDIFPVDSEYRKSLSTPNMTTAIDCYSRMITGFSVSFFPTSGQFFRSSCSDDFTKAKIHRDI